MIDTIPPGRHARMAWRSVPAVGLHARGLLDAIDRVEGAVPVVGLHVHRVDHGVGATGSG